MSSIASCAGPPGASSLTARMTLVMVVDRRGLALAEDEERDQARRQVIAGIARHGVQRARRLVNRLAGLEQDRLAAIKPEHHASFDHVHVRTGRVPVHLAREPAGLIVDADGLNGEPVAKREVEYGSEALTGIRVGQQNLLERVETTLTVRPQGAVGDRVWHRRDRESRRPIRFAATPMPQARNPSGPRSRPPAA